MAGIFAHDWNILGKDRIRRWPSKIGEKRAVRVTIDTWIGISFGAHHWYVEVIEEDNEWWSEEENAWVHLSCDSERGGINLKAAVDSQDKAVELARWFVKTMFCAESSDIRWTGPGDPGMVRERSEP